MAAIIPSRGWQSETWRVFPNSDSNSYSLENKPGLKWLIVESPLGPLPEPVFQKLMKGLNIQSSIEELTIQEPAILDEKKAEMIGEMLLYNVTLRILRLERYSSFIGFSKIAIPLKFHMYLQTLTLQSFHIIEDEAMFFLGQLIKENRSIRTLKLSSEQGFSPRALELLSESLGFSETIRTLFIIIGRAASAKVDFDTFFHNLSERNASIYWLQLDLSNGRPETPIQSARISAFCNRNILNTSHKCGTLLGRLLRIGGVCRRR